MANDINVPTQPAQSSVTAADNLLARRHETCALGDYPCRSCLAINVAANLLDAIDALHQPITVWEVHDGSVRLCACGIESCPTARLLHPEEARRG